MASPPFTPAALDEIAEYLVSDRDTHRVLNRKFAELGISEQRPEPSPKEEAAFKTMGMQRGVDYYVTGPSKRDRLRHAVHFQNKRSGNKGVLQLIKALNEPVVYSKDPDGFREFWRELAGGRSLQPLLPSQGEGIAGAARHAGKPKPAGSIPILDQPAQPGMFL